MAQSAIGPTLRNGHDFECLLTLLALIQVKALYRRSIRDAILRIIDSHEKKPQGRTSRLLTIVKLRSFSVDGYLLDQS